MIQKLLAALVLISGVAFTSGVTAVSVASPASAACSDSVFLIPAWYRGMQGADCAFNVSYTHLDVYKRQPVK